MGPFGLEIRIVESEEEKKAEKIPDAVAFVLEELQFKPDETQERVLRGGRRGIVNCTRQWGKSTVTALKAVHRAYSRPGSLILVLGPSKRQSGNFCGKRRTSFGGWGSGSEVTAITGPFCFRMGHGLWGCR